MDLGAKGGIGGVAVPIEPRCWGRRKPRPPPGRTSEPANLTARTGDSAAIMSTWTPESIISFSGSDKMCIIRIQGSCDSNRLPSSFLRGPLDVVGEHLAHRKQAGKRAVVCS